MKLWLLVAGDFRVGMQLQRASGMGETRDSGRGAGEGEGVADANTWPRSRALANPSPTELLGETVRELGRSWRGSGSWLWYDGASISFHRVISHS